VTDNNRAVAQLTSTLADGAVTVSIPARSVVTVHINKASGPPPGPTSTATTTTTTPTTTASTPTSTPTQPGACSVAAYGQCGGDGWSGCTSCVAGRTCTALNSFYHQCL
jgi:hypothetical protein